MAIGLSKLSNLGISERVGSAISKIFSSIFRMSSTITQLSIVNILVDENGDPINETEFEKRKDAQEKWIEARKTLYWCESRTRKLVKIGAILTTVLIIIRVILRIAKLAARFSPPAAAEFTTVYYKAQDILKKAATVTALITAMTLLINRICAERLEELMSLQDKFFTGDPNIDYGETDPDPFFNEDESEFNNALVDIQNEMEELNRVRAPQTQSECDIVFDKLGAIETLGDIISDANYIQNEPTLFLQYRGGSRSISELKDRIRDIRLDLQNSDPPVQGGTASVKSLFPDPSKMIDGVYTKDDLMEFTENTPITDVDLGDPCYTKPNSDDTVNGGGDSADPTDDNGRGFVDGKDDFTDIFK